MKTTIVQKHKTSSCGILRTSRGSVIHVTVENMPITLTGALTVATGVAYGHPSEPRKGGASVGQNIYIGQPMYDNAHYYTGTQSLEESETQTKKSLTNK